jgi:predicted CopG family antitoxin
MATESSETKMKGKRTLLKRIVVSEHNYLALKKLGYAGDSFNDVISRLLRIERNYREMKKMKEQQEEQQQQQQQENYDNNSHGSYIDSVLSSALSPSAMLAEKKNNQEMAEIVQWLRESMKREDKKSKGNQTSAQDSDSTTPSI